MAFEHFGQKHVDKDCSVAMRGLQAPKQLEGLWATKEHGRPTSVIEARSYTGPRDFDQKD